MNAATMWIDVFVLEKCPEIPHKYAVMKYWYFSGWKQSEAPGTGEAFQRTFVYWFMLPHTVDRCFCTWIMPGNSTQVWCDEVLVFFKLKAVWISRKMERHLSQNEHDECCHLLWKAIALTWEILGNSMASKLWWSTSIFFFQVECSSLAPGIGRSIHLYKCVNRSWAQLTIRNARKSHGESLCVCVKDDITAGVRKYYGECIHRFYELASTLIFKSFSYMVGRATSAFVSSFEQMYETK